MKIIGKWITGWEVRSSCTRLAVQTKNLQFKFNENTLTSGKTWNLIKKLVCNVVCHCGDRFLNALWKLFWHQEMQTNKNSRYLISQHSTKKNMIQSVKIWSIAWHYISFLHFSYAKMFLFRYISLNWKRLGCVGLHWLLSRRFFWHFLNSAEKSFLANTINPDWRYPLAKCMPNKLCRFVFVSFSFHFVLFGRKWTPYIWSQLEPNNSKIFPIVDCGQRDLRMFAV